MAARARPWCVSTRGGYLGGGQLKGGSDESRDEQHAARRHLSSGAPRHVSCLSRASARRDGLLLLSRWKKWASPLYCIIVLAAHANET